MDDSNHILVSINIMLSASIDLTLDPSIFGADLLDEFTINIRFFDVFRDCTDAILLEHEFADQVH